MPRDVAMSSEPVLHVYLWQHEKKHLWILGTVQAWNSENYPSPVKQWADEVFWVATCIVRGRSRDDMKFQMHYSLSFSGLFKNSAYKASPLLIYRAGDWIACSRLRAIQVVTDVRPTRVITVRLYGRWVLASCAGGYGFCADLATLAVLAQS